MFTRPSASTLPSGRFPIIYTKHCCSNLRSTTSVSEPNLQVLPGMSRPTDEAPQPKRHAHCPHSHQKIWKAGFPNHFAPVTDKCREVSRQVQENSEQPECTCQHRHSNFLLTEGLKILLTVPTITARVCLERRKAAKWSRALRKGCIEDPLFSSSLQFFARLFPLRISPQRRSDVDRR